MVTEIKTPTPLTGLEENQKHHPGASAPGY